MGLSPHILIAEDIESNYLYLSAVLSKINAHISWAKNGVEAVRFCEDNDNVNLVLMDIQMPEMNGYDATREIKTMRKNLPIIAQTAYTMLEGKEKAIEAGCDDYLAKPIKSKDLLDTVLKYLQF